MKVLVAVKRVIDYNVKVRVKPDNTGVDLANHIGQREGATRHTPFSCKLGACSVAFH